MSSQPSIDDVWNRIRNREGDAFSTKTGKVFKYAVSGNVLRPDRAQQNLPKSEFAKALSLWPLDGPGKISNLVRGSAYIWAILHDPRILGDEMVADAAPVAESAARATTSPVRRYAATTEAPALVAEAHAEALHLDSRYSAFSGDFASVNLEFEVGLYTDIFGAKNNKTLAQTLEQPRYSKLASPTAARYADQLAVPLGSFLLELKARGDLLYTKFLNAYGDLAYCTFRIADATFSGRRGIYAYTVGSELSYIGRCRDSMGQRVNQGYGKIHPKNCYLDGQATNCHLNAEIARVADQVALWMHPMDSVDEIEREEISLIRTYGPPWNLQRG